MIVNGRTCCLFPLIGSTDHQLNIWKLHRSKQVNPFNALWGYPHVKWEIENLCQITTTAPIFLKFNYFRQKYLEIASCAVSLLNYIWVRVEHSLR